MMAVHLDRTRSGKCRAHLKYPLEARDVVLFQTLKCPTHWGEQPCISNRADAYTHLEVCSEFSPSISSTFLLQSPGSRCKTLPIAFLTSFRRPGSASASVSSLPPSSQYMNFHTLRITTNGTWFSNNHMSDISWPRYGTTYIDPNGSSTGKRDLSSVSAEFEVDSGTYSVETERKMRKQIRKIPSSINKTRA
ncbi:hypothetical protein Mapa_008041 [Marchantia paleacea]|nr:hypothetical protein Mapa_008041 [Marchantia paleacea]